MKTTAQRRSRRSVMLALRKALALLLSGLIALPPASVLAQTVPSGATATTVLPSGSGNGVPVVNIAAPNAAGLSHNKFNSYNVPAQGQILNNSAANVQTQLGGMILGNPNVAGARAAIILNEVVQPNRSMLSGYQEVAGQAAQVVIANPYGITCSGCGFINTPRATLTTGVPTLDAAGNLTGFSVRQGDILINGGGLDATGQNYFELVARSVVLQGQVNAKDLLVAAGSNDFNYAARSVAAAAPVGAAPSYAIDSSLLGGMYVDRIRLIATEAGVGVRLLGNVGASIDDITLSAAGRIALANQMSAQRDLAIAYTGAPQAGAVDIGGGAQLYAARNFDLAPGAGGIALGNALVGAGGNLALTGASLSDAGAVTDYRFANGALSVNVAGAANLGGASYDAVGALSITGGSLNLGSASLLGRSAASGVNIAATAGALEVNGAQVSSPGSVVLMSTGPMTLGAAAFVASNANLTATFGGSLSNAGTMVADGNLQLLNSTASAILVNDGYLSATGAMTLGAANLGSFENRTGSTTLAGTLTLNAPSVLNSGYLQANSASFATGTNLQNSTGGTLVLGTAAADSNTLTLNRLENRGTLYSAGNLTLSTIQLDNLAGGKLIADGTLTASANRAIGATGLSNTLTNAGSIDANDATLSAAAINLTGGTTYAANNLELDATDALTLGGSLYAGNNLTVDANTLSDIVAGTRGAGNNFTLTLPTTLDLYRGQVYDAGNTLTISAPQVRISTTDLVGNPNATTLTAGASLVVNTDKLYLGSALAAGSLQSTGSVVLAQRTPAGLDLQVRNLSGNRSSILAGGDVSITASDSTISGDIVANGDITVRPDARGYINFTVAANGWVQAGDTLSVRTGTASRGTVDTYVGAGGTLSANTLDIYGSSLTVAGSGGIAALLQGGTGGGLIDVTTLSLPNTDSRIIANRWTPTTPATTVNIGTAYTNQGLLYAEKDMVVTVNGNIVNAATGSISSGYGGLTLRTNLGDSSVPYQITNHGLIYGGGGLTMLVPEAGTIYNTPTGNISTGLGSNALLGQNSTSGVYGGTFTNQGVIEFGGNAEIRAASFFNNRPLGGITRSFDGGSDARFYNSNGDSGRYDYFLGQEGWDRKHSSIYPTLGAGDHSGRPNQGSFGVSYYHVIADASRLYRDFTRTWTESDSIANPGALTPQILANGTLVIRTFTGQNIAGSISGGNLQIRNIYPGVPGSSFLNQSVDLYRYNLQSFGRTRYDCNSGVACVDAIGATGFNPVDVYATWTNGAPHGNWGVNDGVPQQTGQAPLTPLTPYAATLFAPSGQFFSDVDNLVNSTGTLIAPTPTATTTAPLAVPNANPSNPAPAGAPQAAPGTTAIGGANVTLPTGPLGLFVVSTKPSSRFLVESNPLYASAYNPYLGSDYLAKLLGLDPDGLQLRLGDANYEAKLIRDQLVAQTGSSLLRTAYDAYDQQKILMDSASLEAKELKLNLGAALTAEQVASLKHDIVWMVEQVVQGKKVLVPVVYLSSATRAGLSGASIVADTAVITGDSFLNRGGKVSGASNLVIVTRKDLVNSSGELSGGNVQLQSLEGDIINRTETFRTGDASNFTTSAGRSGGIFASNSLFMKADRDVNVQGAAVSSGGDATVLAGRNVNVSALVLDARSTNIQNTSGMFNRDVTQTVETTQTAQGASITAGGNLTVGAKNDVNLTGAFVGSTGTTTLISERGNVNIGTVQLTNTKQESTEHVGFFAESRAGSKPPAQDAAAASGTASAPPTQTTQAPTVSGSASRTVTADSAKTGSQKPPADPNATSAEAFTGLAITTTQASSTATGNLGSTVQGGGVNIIATQGNVNIQGSNVASGTQGTLIDAAGNVNITAAYDTTSSTRKEQSTRIGVAAEAGPGGAFAGIKVDGSSLDSQKSSSTASTSALTSGGSVSIRAGGTLTNEGTTINAARDVNVIAAKVENKAAANTTTTNERSTNFNVSVMGGLTTGGIGDSVAGLVQGTGRELNIGSPEAQLRAKASGSSTETTGSTSTAVVTQIKSGGNTNFQVSGSMVDQGTTFSSGGNINLDVGSYENRAAANTSTMTTNSTSGGGTLTVGVDASRSANANLAIQGRNERSTTSTSTAVVGGIQAGGSVNIRSRGDVTLEGTKVGAASNVNIDAAGALNVLQANSTSTTNSKTSDGSANLSASLCVDLSCASAGGGASARTTTLNENVREGVAGSISGANVTLRSGGNTTLQGTVIQSAGTVALDAGGKVDFQALTSTISSTSTADGGGANLNANVGASGKLATDGGGGGDFSFERGRGTTEGTVRQGGSITAGALSIRSGGDTRLEGTQVQAGSAALNVGGNLTLESAQSTLKQDNSGVSGGVQVSGGKSGDGGRNFGGAISLDVTNQTKDNLSNQNATISTTGATTLNVGGDATLAGANINAQGGVGGRIQGNLTVETRADREKTEDTSFRGYVGVGNIQTSGKGDGSKPSTANKIDSAQDKIGNVANTAGGTGVFIDFKSDKTDNVTIGQRSGISGGAGGLGGLTVGGNATLTGAQDTQGINVQGTTTSSAGPQTRQQTTSDSFNLRGTVASAAGSDQGSGGTFSNVFQASGGTRKPSPTPDSGPVTRPRSGAVSGDAARPTNLGGASAPDVPTTRPRSGAVSGEGARPVLGASDPVTRPRANAVSGEGARPIAGGSGALPVARPRADSAPLPRSAGNELPARPRADSDGATPKPPAMERIELTPSAPLIQKVDAAPPLVIRERPADDLSGARPPAQGPATTADGPAPKPAAAPLRSDYVTLPVQQTKPAASSAITPRDTNPTTVSRGLGDAGNEGPGIVRGAEVIASVNPVPKPAATGTPKPAADSAPKPAAPAAPVSIPSTPAPVSKTPGEARPLVDPASGKVVHVQNVTEANLNGRVVDGFKVSDAPPPVQQDKHVILSGADRANKELTTNAAGELVYKADQSIEFDTAGGSTQFVVDAQGRIFAGDPFKPDPKLTHLSLSGGTPTRIAGDIQVQDGRIVQIDNRSDTYASSQEQAMKAVVALRDQGGVDMTGAQIGFFQPQVVDNPDGSKRTVQLALSSDGTHVAHVEDSGPPTAAALNAKKVADAMPRIALGNEGREILRAPDTRLKVTTPAVKYSGEEGKGVKYLTGSERARNELVVRDGKLVSKETGKPFSTGTKEDGAIFAIDAQGRMYASTENKVGEFHHTSLTGGEPVASAGHVVVRDGVLLHMNNFSGHYQPDSEMLKQGIDLLQGQGLRFDNTRVVQLSPTGLQEMDLKTGAVKGMPQGPGTPNATFNDVIRHDAERARAEDNIALMATLKPAGDGNAGRKLFENPANGLKLTTAASNYKDENKPKLDANGKLERQGVKYLSGDERARAEVVVKDGKLVSKVTGEPFSTGSKEDGAIFVIDAQGRMYASTGNKVGEFHHTSLTGGEPVASAGHVVVRDGVLLHINNFSGHYQPDTGMLKQGVDLLKKQGLDMADTRVVQLSPTGLQEVDLNTGAVKGMPQGKGTENAIFNDVIRVDAERARAKDNAALLATLRPVADGDAGRKILENPANGLKLTTAADEYKNETKPKFDKDGKFERPGVKYFSEKERARNEVVVVGGKLVYADDHTPVNTGAKEDGAIFVIDAQGRMYASTENAVGVIHHTSLTGGEPVAAAGHMVVRDGQLLHINNMSGHYRPDETMLQQGVELLKGQGIDLSEANIVRYNSTNGELERTDANGNAIAVIPRAGMNDVFDLTRPDALRAAPPAAAPAPAAPSPVAPPGKTSSNGDWRLAA